jgi:MFS family permease
MPIRQSIVANLVPRDDLMNALALSSATFNVTRIIGPSIAGLLIVAIGIAGNFYLQALMYVGVATMVLLMVIPARERTAPKGSTWRTLKEGAGYVWHQPHLRSQMALALVPVVVALPYVSLMPVFAQDVLRVGPQGFGLMMAAPGIGAVVGTLLLATFGNSRRKGRLLFAGLTGLGICLILFATSRSFPLSLLLLTLVGACQMTFLTTNQTLLHMAVPDEFRGRVMGIYMLNQGLLPFGSLFIGALADVWTAPFAVTVMASLLLLLTVTAFLFLPTLRDA